MSWMLFATTLCDATSVTFSIATSAFKSFLMAWRASVPMAAMLVAPWLLAFRR